MRTILSQVPDISSVPADQVKWWFLMAAFALGMYVLARRAKTRTGGSDEPLHLQQPVHVQKAAEYAPKEETARHIQTLSAKMESMARENLRQHNAAADKVDARLREIMAAGGKRGEKIMACIIAMEQRMGQLVREEVRNVHERVNPLAEKVSAHGSAIEWIERKLSACWDAITGLGKRIDDAIRLFGSKGKS